MTPGGVEVMRQNGHTVLVETSAGMGSGYDDQAYIDAGAEIVAGAAEVFGRADMVDACKGTTAGRVPDDPRGSDCLYLSAFSSG